MRTLFASVFALAALAGCATVPGSYDYGYAAPNDYSYYGYGDGYYYYDTAPAYYGYFGYNRYHYNNPDRYYYYNNPGYSGGVVVNRSVVQGSVQQHRFSDRRSGTRDRTVASATSRATSRTFSSNAPKSERQVSRASAKRERERSHLAGTTRQVDHGS